MGSVRNTSCGATQTTCTACDVFETRVPERRGPGPGRRNGAAGSFAAPSAGPAARGGETLLPSCHFAAPAAGRGGTSGLMDHVRLRLAEKRIEMSASPLKRRECVIPRGDSPTPLTAERSRKFPDSDMKPCCELPAPRPCAPLRCWDR